LVKNDFAVAASIFGVTEPVTHTNPSHWLYKQSHILLSNMLAIVLEDFTYSGVQLKFSVTDSQHECQPECP